MKIKTARVGYKPEPNELVIDITVKNNPNHVLAPTWDMVMDFKKGKISWGEYKEKYLDLLRRRWKTRKAEFMHIIEEGQTKTVVLLCFCNDETRCHRTIAKDVLHMISYYPEKTDLNLFLASLTSLMATSG